MWDGFLIEHSVFGRRVTRSVAYFRAFRGLWGHHCGDTFRGRPAQKLCFTTCGVWFLFCQMLLASAVEFL
jgi:hypothetical protein